MTDRMYEMIGTQARKPSGGLGKTMFGHLAARMEFPIYSGAEVVEMLTEAGFSRAWFEAVPEESWGWLCALGVK